MNMTEAVKTCFAKYFTFSGRARRSEFWWFFLFLALAGVVTAFLDSLLFGLSAISEVGPINGLFSLATLVPAFSVGARRLHDKGRSGWWQLLLLLPVIGVIVLIVWWATKGDNGTNRFGNDPLVEQDIEWF